MPAYRGRHRREPLPVWLLVLPTLAATGIGAGILAVRLVQHFGWLPHP